MFEIPEELAGKLERAAARKNQSVIEMLEAVADDVLLPDEPQKRNFLLELADAAKAANLQFSEPNVASRSRELLERDFANDIDYRIRRD